MKSRNESVIEAGFPAFAGTFRHSPGKGVKIGREDELYTQELAKNRLTPVVSCSDALKLMRRCEGD